MATDQRTNEFSLSLNSLLPILEQAVRKIGLEMGYLVEEPEGGDGGRLEQC